MLYKKMYVYKHLSQLNEMLSLNQHKKSLFPSEGLNCQDKLFVSHASTRVQSKVENA